MARLNATLKYRQNYAVSMADVVGLFGQYIAFLISAVLTALAFWWKKQVVFDKMKFIETVVTAFILASVAFVLYVLGVLPMPDVVTVETYITTLGLAGPFTLMVQAIAKGIWRNLMGQGAPGG